MQDEQWDKLKYKFVVDITKKDVNLFTENELKIFKNFKEEQYQERRIHPFAD